MAEPLRVALCDDHAVVRRGLCLVLEGQPDISVVGESGSTEEAIKLAETEHPDVFIVDLSLPGASGLVAVRGILRASSETRVLILTMHDDLEYLREAFDAGASGYLMKGAADTDLVVAVRAVAAGQQYVHPSLGAALVTGPARTLSNREREVLRLLALGNTNAQIAGELYLSIRTVATHRLHIQQKLGLRSRSELVRFARESGLI